HGPVGEALVLAEFDHDVGDEFGHGRPHTCYAARLTWATFDLTITLQASLAISTRPEELRHEVLLRDRCFLGRNPRAHVDPLTASGRVLSCPAVRSVGR